MANYSSSTILNRRTGSAATLRERLLSDPQIRRNQPAYTSPPAELVAPITVTFASANVHPCLSAAEQQQRAIQVAKSYKSHFLAEYSYRDDQNVAVAVIRPRSASDSVQQICVDADGNVSILADDLPQRLILSRVAVVLSGMVAAIGTLMWIILS
ncbi:MAG TPA: hypothetical protein VHP83_20610 [Aggregatilineaceae bacterium]|nr:hypothetical protein [Aggregatilineaceae bacterium]